jgi:hypothetical protein
MRLVTPIPEAHAWRPEMLEILWAGDIAPGERADAIDRLLPKIAAIEPEADTVEAQFFKAYREALSIGAELFRWDHTVRASERDAVRHLDAAKRRAETLQLLEHPLFPPLKTAVQLVASIKSPRDSETYARAIAQVPVPVRVLARRPAPRGWRRPIRRSVWYGSTTSPLFTRMSFTPSVSTSSALRRGSRAGQDGPIACVST